MSREEFEAYLLDEVKKIRKVYEQYCPEDPYLTICLNSGRFIGANNSYWEDWCENKVALSFRGDE